MSLSCSASVLACCSVFFFNDTATTEIYTLSLHDALPISRLPRQDVRVFAPARPEVADGLQGEGAERHRHGAAWGGGLDRKSTRLNSSHANISYAVFCLKKKISIDHKSATHDMRHRIHDQS